MRIGFFLDSLVDGYQSQLLLGVHRECVRQGVDLYCLVGGTVAEPPQANPLYDLVDKHDFDGLIVSGCTLTGMNATAGLSGLFSRFPEVPKVSIGLTSGEVPGIQVDNASGVREMVGHLVRAHGRKRIAFLRVHRPDGEERYQGYLAGLKDAGLAPDQRLIIDSQFQLSSGREASTRLQRESFDAVIASSDWQAIGLIAALQLRGVRVPDDVAVAGFDDITEASFMIPSLSTVRQPITQLGAMAVADVLARLRGKPAVAEEKVPTTLCYRASCGCRSMVVPTVPPPAQTGNRSLWELIRQSETLIQSLDRHTTALGLHEHPHWAQSLVDALLADLQESTTRKFVAALGLRLDRFSAREGLTHWHLPLMELRAACMPYLANCAPDAMHAMDVFEKAHVLVSLSAESAQGHQRLNQSRLFQDLQFVGRPWRESLTRGQTTKGLGQRLDLIGIPSVYVVGRDDHLQSQGKARLIFSYLNSRATQATQPRVFRAGEIVPKADAPFRRHTMVVFPLEQGLDYCAVEMGPEDPQVYNATQAHINAARLCLDKPSSTP